MCSRCNETTKELVCIGWGSFFLLVALCVGVLWPKITTDILESKFELKEGSLSYQKWIATPIPMYLRITMFNWTNADSISTQDYKPNLVEMGPYVFLEKHERVNVSFNQENDTVSFYQKRTWHFVPELSNGTLDDEVTNVNVIAASATYNLRHHNAILRYGANKILELFHTKLHVTKPVRELLFNGYNDPLLTLIKELKLPGVVVPPFNKFGWFVDRNESSTYDGFFEMFSGQTDIQRMGTMTHWNYVNKTKFYRDECSDVNGTSGELWPMHMQATEDITFFIPDLCRPLTLAYQQPHTLYDLKGSQWVGDYRVFDNGTKYPPNLCYCTSDESSCPDVLTGVHNLSDCRFGAPIFVSFPHFYLGDEAYVKAVDGLAPNQSRHEFSISIEPTTGIPLEVNAKLQINTLIQPVPGLKILENVPTVLIPAFWFAETVELDENSANEAKIAVWLLSTKAYVEVISPIFVLSLFGFVSVALLRYRRRRLGYQNLDDQESSD